MYLGKMALLEAGLDGLADWAKVDVGRPIRLRTTKQVGDFDAAFLFTEGEEAQIWDGIDMAQYMPSSCTFYFGWSINKANFPIVLIDPRRQPKTDQVEGEAGRGRMEKEQM